MVIAKITREDAEGATDGATVTREDTRINGHSGGRRMFIQMWHEVAFLEDDFPTVQTMVVLYISAFKATVLDNLKQD